MYSTGAQASCFSRMPAEPLSGNRCFSEQRATPRRHEGVPRKNPPDATGGPLVSVVEGNSCFTRCFVISLRASVASCQVTRVRVKWNDGRRMFQAFENCFFSAQCAEP